MKREGFIKISHGWHADGFDALMARINLLGDWVTQNGGPDSLTEEEGRTVSGMMACALRHGLAGTVPKAEMRQ